MITFIIAYILIGIIVLLIALYVSIDIDSKCSIIDRIKYSIKEDMSILGNFMYIVYIYSIICFPLTILLILITKLFIKDKSQ